MKRFCFLLVAALILSACAPGSSASPTPQVLQITEPATLPATFTATLAPTDTPLPTATSTFTLTPTRRLTSTPAATPLGGGSGQLMSMVSLNLVRYAVDDPMDVEIVIPFSTITSKLKIEEFSTTRSDTVSPAGDLVAFWNCSTEYCDTKRGTLYLFSTDFKKQATIDVPGQPYFGGWSANLDRLLYYLGSTMSDDYYMVKTKDPGFGEVIKLGRLSVAGWAPDGETLYAQKGSAVYHYDKDGNELEKFECKYNNACVQAISPDGKHFAGIQKFVPTGQGNPVINVTDPTFTDKKSLFISDDKALILSVLWLPDNRNIVVIGISAKQRVHRFWRLDYLSVINTTTGTERLIDLHIPDDVENFSFCGMTPDGKHLVYTSIGGRVKEQGRILMSSRNSVIVPIWSDAPTMTRLLDLDDVWESCPVWLESWTPRSGSSIEAN